MIGKKGPAIWVILIALTLSLRVVSAGQRRNQQQQQQQQQQQGQGQQGIGPQVKSKDEADAFNTLQMEQNPAKRVELAEAFVAKFPDSEFVSYAHTFRVTAYSLLGKHKESAAAAEQAIDTTIKFGEKLVAKATSTRQQSLLRVKAAKPRDIVRIEQELSDALTASVEIRVKKRTARGEQGEVVIGFGSLDELNGLLDKLGLTRP